MNLHHFLLKLLYDHHIKTNNSAINELLTQSLVHEAAKSWPLPVLSEWLMFRTSAADQFFPTWEQTIDLKKRIQILDDSAVLQASLN